MTEQKRNIAVGVTALVGVVGLIVLILLFGDMPRWMARGGYNVQVTFPDADGLAVGSRVRLAGIDIGRIDDIRLLEPAQRGIVATARIEQDVDIPMAVRPVILRPLLGGGAILSLEVSKIPEDQDVAVLPRDGQVILQGRPSSMMSDLAESVQHLLEGPSEQLAAMTERFASLSVQWEQVGQNINHLIEPRSVADVDNHDQPGNLSTVLARTDQRLAELQQVLAGLDRYVSDEQLHADIRSTVQHARQTMEHAAALTETARDQVDRVSTRFVAAADDFSAAMQQANRLLEQARQGQGALGKLMSDPALYDNLNDAAERLQVALDEIVLLVQKWKQEGLPIQF